MNARGALLSVLVGVLLLAGVTPDTLADDEQIHITSDAGGIKADPNPWGPCEDDDLIEVFNDTDDLLWLCKKPPDDPNNPSHWDKVNPGGLPKVFEASDEHEVIYVRRTPPADGIESLTLPERWFEDFDAYANGSSMHGQGEWQGWDNDSAYTAYVTDAQSQSPPHSLDAAGDTDLVHKYSGFTSGQWIYTAWQYIPADFSNGDPVSTPPGTYFILLNKYNDGGPNNWSVQLDFDADTGMLVGDCGAEDNVSMPYVADRWVEIRVNIDLDEDWTQVHYDGVLLDDPGLPDHPELGGGYQWSTGIFGNDVDGLLNIGAVDLFANGATSVYYDDMSLDAPAPMCQGDLDGDDDTDQGDLGMLLSDWGCPRGGCIGDLDGDGDTDQGDLGILLADWGCGT
jgi:hypothetical protein